MVWKTIKGYIDYQISEKGEIRRKKTFRRGKNSYETYVTIKPFVVNGLYAVNLWNNAERKSFMVHNLYVAAFNVPLKDAMRIIYKGFQGSEQAKRNIKKWLGDKIIECEKLISEEGENKNDEILYLKEFLSEI